MGQKCRYLAQNASFGPNISWGNVIISKETLIYRWKGVVKEVMLFSVIKTKIIGTVHIFRLVRQILPRKEAFVTAQIWFFRQYSWNIEEWRGCLLFVFQAVGKSSNMDNYVDCTQYPTIYETLPAIYDLWRHQWKLLNDTKQTESALLLTPVSDLYLTSEVHKNAFICANNASVLNKERM